MAGLLFRIGRFAARRAWLVILSWVVVLAAAGGAFLAGSGPTSDQIEIPNTPTTEVQDRLRSIMDDEERDAELAEADAASTVRTIVVTTDAPGGFTSGQRADVERVVQQLSELPLVQAVSNPWAAVDELSEQRERFEAADGQLEAGEQQLRAAQEGLAQAAARRATCAASSPRNGRASMTRHTRWRSSDRRSTARASCSTGRDRLRTCHRTSAPR